MHGEHMVNERSVFKNYLGVDLKFQLKVCTYPPFNLDNTQPMVFSYHEHQYTDEFQEWCRDQISID